MFHLKSTIAAATVLSGLSGAALAEDGELLSAGFGANNAFPQGSSLFVCQGAEGLDGMPVIFPELVERRPSPQDFQVTGANGDVRPVTCVTFDPADDPGEQRTVLLVGEFGGADDQPARVEVVGELRSKNRQVAFQGESVAISPLEAGPSIVMAEYVPRSLWRPEDAGTQFGWGGGNACPYDGVEQIVRVVWGGGVLRPDGTEVGEIERDAYAVTLRQPGGRLLTVSPIALGDLNDRDNNHELCLAERGIPVSVSFPAGLLVDPNGDLNEESRVLVHGR